MSRIVFTRLNLGSWPHWPPSPLPGSGSFLWTGRFLFTGIGAALWMLGGRVSIRSCCCR